MCRRNGNRSLAKIKQHLTTVSAHTAEFAEEIRRRLRENAVHF
jgi:hypothetical protein